jgi:ABC-2 type transport system permease protein
MMPAIRAEWVKVRTTPATAWLLLGLLVTVVATNALSLAAMRCPAAGCGQDPGKTGFAGVDVGQAIVAVLAVLTVCGEYAGGLISVSLTATPRRERVLAAKALVATGLVLAVSAVTMAVTVLIARLVLPGKGFTGAHGYAPLVSASLLRAAAGSVLYLGLVAVLASGVAWAVRDAATATGVVLGLLYLFPVLAGMLGPAWRWHLEQIAPMPAGEDIQATLGLRSLPLPPWAGLGVLALWSLAAFTSGAMLLRLRDA